MGLFKKKKDQFKAISPENVSARASPTEAEIIEQKVEQPNPQQIAEEIPMVQQPVQPVQQVQPQPVAQPVTKYVEVPVDVSNEDNQRLWNYENNRMLKELMKYTKE